MWKISLSKALFIAVFFCLCLLCVGTAYAQTAETDTITISRQDWQILMQNNELQRKALEESQWELGAVKKAQSESETALSEVRTLLETSQMESDEMTKLCATLLTELQTQKAENARLMQELKNAKAESQTAYDAIQKANQYLIDTKKAIEANEAAWRKREHQLECQRLEWQIASVLIGYVGYKIGRN